MIPDTTAAQTARFSPIGDLLPQTGSADLDDYVLDLHWSPDGSLLAALPSTGAPTLLATASDGGARLWRLGKTEPVGRIDDGVAALGLTWSPDGRWLVTGDQTPSVHLLDIPKSEPLFIQGFDSKVKAFAWLTAGRKDVPWLAVAGSATLSLWPCFGKKGPRGSTPLQLKGHLLEAK